MTGAAIILFSMLRQARNQIINRIAPRQSPIFKELKEFKHVLQEHELDDERTVLNIFIGNGELLWNASIDIQNLYTNIRNYNEEILTVPEGRICQSKAIMLNTLTGVLSGEK
jgi:hypothetical protein